VSQTTGATRSTVILIIAVLFLPLRGLAEIIIDLKNGEQIVVPVDRTEVQGIRFTDRRESDSGRPVPAGVPVTGTSAASADTAGVKTWHVGPKRALKFPSDAAKVAGDGDTIEIDAGVYHNDYVRWTQNDLSIRGVGGMAHLKSKGLIPNKKAIWITRGDGIRIENIEFSGAAVRDTNGAGIRHEGGKLELENTFFHDNEFSILSGGGSEVSIEVHNSRFWFQARQNRFSHGIYIGAVGSFTLLGSHVKGTDQGHQVKSRALQNKILYNRIEDVPGGNSSRLIDLSNCGQSFIIGNDLHQAETTENTNIIGYGAEGCPKRTGAQMQIYVVNNTLVNEAPSGTLLNNHAGGHAVVANNLIFGRVNILAGEGREMNNVVEDLDQRARNRWNAPDGSKAIDGAKPLPSTDGVSLVPSMEFNPPLGTRERPQRGELDVGSRESSL